MNYSTQNVSNFRTLTLFVSRNFALLGAPSLSYDFARGWRCIRILEKSSLMHVQQQVSTSAFWHLNPSI